MSELDTLASCDKNAAIRDDTFQGMPESACLQGVDKAMGWS